MAHYGILRGESVVEAGEDVRGSHLYGVGNEKLGKIDDVIFDHSSGDIRYIVVDTGGWLKSHKFIVPTTGLRSSAKHENDYEANLTKQQVESFPPYNESDLKSEQKWSKYEGQYRSKWVADPVMHRAETDRNITPTTYQATGNLESERAAAAQGHGGATPVRKSAVPLRSNDDIAAVSSPTERVVPAGSDAVVIDNSAVGIGGRWDTFQSRLRERRKQAVASCETCTGDSSRIDSDDAGTLRKAV